MINHIEFGDCRDSLRRWAADGVKVQACVTSPPYFGLRDYGVAGQIGLEPTPEQYIAGLVEVFRCVRDVLADDGTLWLNIGDSYANVGKWGGSSGGKHASALHGDTGIGRGKRGYGDLKGKDLIGTPWMLAFALRADGWHLRQDIIWHKPNPMPESVRDRCTKAHEYIFLLSKSPKYYFDAEAIKEPAVSDHPPGNKTHKGATAYVEQKGEFHRAKVGLVGYANRVRERKGCPNGAGGETRNRRSVWTVATRPYKGAHFAVYPPELIEPCILAGSRPGDIVLDPFMGSGTTAAVALRHGRAYLGCELNPEYRPLQEARIALARQEAALAAQQRIAQQDLFPPLTAAA